MNFRILSLALASLSLLFPACRARHQPERAGETGSPSAIAAPQPQWIGPPVDAAGADANPCPLLRSSFVLDARPVKATVRIVGLGHYQLRLNGKQVGSYVINQAWSAYDKTLYVQEFDILEMLREGENVFGVRLGNSFWRIGASNDPGRFRGHASDFSAGRPYLLWLEARVRTASGAEMTVITNSGWKWTAGPLTFSDVYGGEDYDARREPEGWDKPGFMAAGWNGVAVLTPPTAKLMPLPGPAMKEFEVFEPTTIRALGPGESTYAFPQNCSALLRFTLSGKAGSRVRFKPAEDLDKAGRVRFPYTWDTGQEVWQDYTLRGGEEESHETVFFYVGCRYVGIKGAVPAGHPNPDGLPFIRKLELVHVRAANMAAGTFSCSSELQNAIGRLSDWAIRSNMSHYATDCPHREKYGWLEQTWHMAKSISYLYDVRDWYRRIIQNIWDSQLPDGHIPTKAPMYLLGADPHGHWHEAPEWGIAGVLDPWHLYEWYGDATVLAASFDSMKRYIDYLTSRAADGIITSNLGDWLDYGHGKEEGPSQWTPQGVSATAVWALGARTMAQAAAVLGRKEEAARYDGLFNQIKRDFLRHFYDPGTKTVKNKGSCQAANAAALCIRLVPDGDRDGALRAIVDDLSRRGWQQTAGEVFHVFLVRALAEGGREDVLDKVYSREGVGSFGHMVNMGLTTLPETWDAKTGTINGLNHFAFGHLVEWHFAYVAGIRQQPGSVGWRDVLIAPQPGSLASAEANFESPAGRISVAWRVSDGKFRIRATVPPDVRATALLPDGTSYPLHVGLNQLSSDWKGDGHDR